MAAAGGSTCCRRPRSASGLLHPLIEPAAGFYGSRRPGLTQPSPSDTTAPHVEEPCCDGKQTVLLFG